MLKAVFWLDREFCFLSQKMVFPGLEGPVSKELAQLTLKCLWLKQRSSVSAVLMCVAVPVSVSV